MNLSHRRPALALCAVFALFAVWQFGCRPSSPGESETAGSTESVAGESATAGEAPTDPIEPNAGSPPARTAGEPVETEPVETEPVETEPGKTEPIETEPGKTEPVEPATVGDDPKDGNQDPPVEGGQSPPADSTKVRAKLFKGWPKPKLVLVFTGNQSGYIEPCGCTGLANQKGGLARRATMLSGLAKRGWPVAAFDVGSQVRRYGAQAELKFRTAADAIAAMPYFGVAFGDDDLRLSVDALLSVCDEDNPLFLSANASVLGVSATHRIVEVGGVKIGVTAVVGEMERQRVNSEEIEQQSTSAGLTKVWPMLETANCDVHILLAHSTLAEAHELARKYSQFDIIVTSGGASEPAYEPEKVEGAGDTLLVQTGAKGMYAGVMGVFAGDERFRFQRVSMNDRYADSKKMLDLMKAYQVQLQTIGLSDLGVRPLPHPTGRTFRGSESCRDCHQGAWDVWVESDHAGATDSIKNPNERVWIQRHFDPECLSCHVTGWNPQKYFPYTSGYLNFDLSKLLRGSGCENCHGPGSAHVAAESGDEDVADEEKMNRRLGMRLSKDDAEKKCLECHDLDNSPDFHQPGAFDRFWEAIEHESDE
jgi:hypothetical protein